MRGMELAQLLTRLGPTFIKSTCKHATPGRMWRGTVCWNCVPVLFFLTEALISITVSFFLLSFAEPKKLVGQSLSIRTDILSPAYVRGLATLQDRVPPFDSKTAKQILEEEWGQSVNSVLSKISDEPVAAASLGQVYKATLKDGREVAIKVQRPNIMKQIALDMHLLREFAPIAKRTFNLNTDTVGTVDAWGAGFVDELNYEQEALNGKMFMEKIQNTPLKEVVIAPKVVDEISTSKVLVTEWIDGERLDKSSSEDITVLCSICMNTYLTMLLELGVLHCDPHPGNLLRTLDGKLCILDWGMVTRLPPELQLTLIEHMAHLTSADYAEVPRDLLLLGFIPEDKADLIKDSGLVEVLADIYGAWTSGGGVAAINVNQVVDQLQELTAKKGNLFQIPPYFAYIAKSFSVLEGIGLSNDPKYSIINECLPYVSQRLLTGKASMGPALSTFIFGPEKGNLETRIVDYKRVEQLVTGFGNYTTSASGALLGSEGKSRTQMLEAAADKVLEIILSEEETPAQEILLEQLAKIVTSSSRSIWEQIRQRSGTLPSGRTVLGTLVDPLGLFRTSPLVAMNDFDQKTVETTRRLIALTQNQLAGRNDMLDLSTLKREEIIQLSSILVRKVWDRRRGLLKTGNRFATMLLQLTANRLEKGERDRFSIQNDIAKRYNPVPDPKPTKQSEAIVTSGTASRRVEAARDRIMGLDEVRNTKSMGTKGISGSMPRSTSIENDIAERYNSVPEPKLRQKIPDKGRSSREKSVESARLKAARERLSDFEKLESDSQGVAVQDAVPVKTKR